MDHEFKKGAIAPWDIGKVGTQFALLAHLENLPNINNIAHM
jgi:hypothetical protein|tara:strand:+ start:4579 stop:4701 length:123 start_codon:yes stop_codon:yes gene_type:complete